MCAIFTRDHLRFNNQIMCGLRFGVGAFVLKKKGFL